MASVRPSSVGGIGPVTPKAMNTTIMMSAAFVIGRPVRAMPSRIARLGVAGGLVALADRGEQEQLVVHRQAEQQGEEEQRCPGVDEALVLDAEQAGADAVLEHERGEAERGADGEQVHQDRERARSTRLRNTTSSSTNATIEDEADRVAARDR